jgi:hypothetical protein
MKKRTGTDNSPELTCAPCEALAWLAIWLENCIGFLRGSADTDEAGESRGGRGGSGKRRPTMGDTGKKDKDKRQHQQADKHAQEAKKKHEQSQKRVL